MALSLSANATDTAIELQMVNGSMGSNAQGIPFANELAGFAEAVAQRDPAEISRTRDNLLQVAGEVVTVDAAGVAANFQRMVRIADSMGIPIDEQNVVAGAGIREELNISRFASAQNTPSANR
jgi:hypothetical protein